MALRINIKSSEKPSKTRSGTVYYHSDRFGSSLASERIDTEIIECAETLMSLRNTLAPITVFEHQHNTRYSSRANTSQF